MITIKLLNLLDKLVLLSDPLKSPLNTHKFFKINYLLNFFKFGAFLFMLFGMAYFNNYSLASWIYLALHGSYGVVWLMKDFYFPDKVFQTKIGFIFIIILSVVLVIYYIPGLLILLKYSNNDLNNNVICICLIIYIIGLVLVIGTDIQKYISLNLNKGKLISNFLLYNNRNTNFLGEFMIYLSFCLLSNHIISYMLVMITLILVFIIRVRSKELSLSKKEGYIEYCEKSYLILFKFHKSHMVNIIIYTLGLIIISLLLINNPASYINY